MKLYFYLWTTYWEVTRGPLGRCSAAGARTPENLNACTRQHECDAYEPNFLRLVCACGFARDMSCES
jgi:hypothetical protein